MAQRIIWDNLSERDVKVISRALVEISTDAVVALSHLSRLQRELRTLNASKEIISATLIPEITRASNKIQQERTEQRKNEELHYLDHFSLELALADVMIMLCIRPAEIKNLRIANGGVTGYAKNRGQQDIPQVFRSLEKNEERTRQLLTWIQEAISSRQLKDPEKPRSTYLSSFLKKDEYISKPYEPLLPSSLRKLGAVFASVVHGPKNLLKANSYASEALRHSPDNHASPSDRYTIVNFRRRGALKKQLENYHSQHNTLEKRVKRLERNVKSLETELEDLNECVELDECVDSETVVDLIHKIVPSLIGKKGLGQRHSLNKGAVHRGGSSDSDIDEVINMIKHQRIREYLA
ncbi:hypothetical protein C1646_677145 [Rhizophagus diaphanus]|nr:hypothetical protein C1646_677145 [Rhizophagus diaphanus] [Rhizophagus sp. MUCL 43196]